jgi:bifunctional DNA-binding transcriptional regulator/antitoxin component of YhaV-PrlF toxin-antitoxin module
VETTEIWTTKKRWPIDKENLMEPIRFTPDGDIRIPKSVLRKYHWTPKTKLILQETGEGLLIKPAQPVKPASPFPRTTLEDVVSLARWSGPAKTLEEMEEAIRKGALESADDRR